MKSLLIFLLVALGVAGGWLAGRRSGSLPASGAPAATAAQRKLLFYQSPMHPWIKSDKPGNCTICGMKLVPVYEGQKPQEGGGAQAGVHLSQQSISVINVETVKVGRQPLKRSLRVAGIIDDDDSRHRRLSAYVDGRIDKLMVNYVGAEVTAGEPLARFYSPALIAARNEFILLSSQTGGGQREPVLEAARQRLIRMGLTAEQVAKLPGTKNPPDYLEVVAPASGTVVERKVYEGQYVKAGDVLFEIADFSQMWFVFDAYERDLAWLKIGQLVDVTTPSVPGKVFTAPIQFIDPNMMRETRTARIRVVIENPHVGDPLKHRHELLHKLYAEGAVHAEFPEILAVPRAAVLSPGPEPLVYVVEKPGQYVPRRVRLGRAGDQFWEVLDGLKEGEEVVTTGNLLLDAQAQLETGSNQSVKNVPARDLSTAQRGAAEKFLAAWAGLGEALAADDLEEYNRRVGGLTPAITALSGAFGADVQTITALAKPGRATDLPAARKAFYGVGAAAARFAGGLRSHEVFSGLKLYECPMAKVAVPSASSDKGQWVQLAAPMRNPFFGKEMADCGNEVKP